MKASEAMKQRRNSPEFVEKHRAGIERAKAEGRLGRRPKTGLAARADRIDVTHFDDRTTEDAVIVYGYRHGLSVRQIAEFIGVSRNVVIGRAGRLGLVHIPADDDRRAAAIHVAADWERRLSVLFPGD